MDAERDPAGRGGPVCVLFLAPIILLLASCAVRQDHAETESAVSATPCDVLIVGGSLGALAAAVGAEGLDVWLVSQDSWLGGQLTTQGVSCLDEHRFVETFGVTREYARLRERLRQKSGGSKNPGGGWVSRLCVTPVVAAEVADEFAARFKCLREARMISARVEGDRVISVTFRTNSGELREFRPKLILEGTDLGDVLEMAGVEHRLGSDSRSDTGEPHADAHADRTRIQAATLAFAVEFRTGESHVVPKPDDYERLRDEQPFTLEHFYADRGRVRYGFFKKFPGAFGSFFDYRRIGPSLALINWPSNDDRSQAWLGGDFSSARRLSKAFLYWLQTECPRDEGGKGYPELLLRGDAMGTPDGFARSPYVREGRRLLARTMVVEQDLVVDQARARPVDDAVGLGHYGIDLHACVGDDGDETGRWIPCRPFQIPLSAMVPIRVKNLLAAGKCLGTSHVTNGAFRVHPNEWAVGEAAGRVAAYCIEHEMLPADLLDSPEQLRELQWRLLNAGVPLYWYEDLGPESETWRAAQYLALSTGVPADPDSLRFDPSPERVRAVLEMVGPMIRQE